jgi:hypothetical protein
LLFFQLKPKLMHYYSINLIASTTALHTAIAAALNYCSIHLNYNQSLYCSSSGYSRTAPYPKAVLIFLSCRLIKLCAPIAVFAEAVVALLGQSYPTRCGCPVVYLCLELTQQQQCYISKFWTEYFNANIT